MRQLCAALQDHPALTSLGLRKNWLGPRHGGGALAALLRGGIPLSSLNLRNNKLYGRGLGPILRALSSSSLAPLEAAGACHSEAAGEAPVVSAGGEEGKKGYRDEEGEENEDEDDDEEEEEEEELPSSSSGARARVDVTDDVAADATTGAPPRRAAREPLSATPTPSPVASSSSPSPRALEALDLRKCKLGPSAARLLAAWLVAEARSLRALHLDGNEIGGRGAVSCE